MVRINALMNDLCVVSLNARGMNSFEKRQKIYDWFRDSNVHIALIKKHIILKRMNLNIIVVGMVKYFMLFQIPPYARGVSVLFNNVDVDVENLHKTQEGRIFFT